MKMTVFTPAYNRAHTLGALYESLRRQTFRDFEWVVVDDGSVDSTAELLKSFEAEGALDMRVFRTANGGKHRAIDLGARQARGELFFIVDSDDTLTDNALERMAYYYEGIRGDDSFAGVSGMMAFPSGERIGGQADFDVLDCTYAERLYRHGIKGDVAYATRTGVMREFPFPDFPGEKFCSEGVLYHQIDAKYKTRHFNEKIYIGDYLADGLTRSIRRAHRLSPRYSMLFASVSERAPLPLMAKIKLRINYWRYTIRYRGERREFPMPWWVIFYYPLGLGFYWWDLFRERR